MSTKCQYNRNYATYSEQSGAAGPNLRKLLDMLQPEGPAAHQSQTLMTNSSHFERRTKKQAAIATKCLKKAGRLSRLPPITALSCAEFEYDGGRGRPRGVCRLKLTPFNLRLNSY